MKKRIALFFGLLLGFCAIGGFAFGINSIRSNENVLIARAEGDESSETLPEEEIFECKVVLDTFEHGSIEVDKTEGHAGELVTIVAKHDLFYLVDYVAVNSTNLVESEESAGHFTFALVEGDNVITAKFAIDEELLGQFSEIYEQVSNKDWTNLFSVKNVITIVNFVLSSGILIAIVRYYVKDKRLENKLEHKVEETMNKLVPETTKQVILKETEEVLTPIFAKTSAYQEEIIRVLAVFIKCFALLQENTPEAKSAILNELANLNVGDNAVIEQAKSIIEQFAQEKLNDLNKLMGKLRDITEKNQAVVAKVEEIVEDNPAEKAKKEENGEKQATE